MFYLAVIQKMTNGTRAQALFPKDTYDEAVASFHSELSYRGEERAFTSCAILNESGNLARPSEFWSRPVPETPSGTPEE